ncbi:pyridoxine-5'-phosphate oxidase-like [Ruditapes philippinarum]|uniref:pyridoxine-5'-phosphate oxidase-like n=1 Tax=Ruditapes philippinarum TaxID=129788 RepID=UPI00295AE518|nr:pyridoxine-5'-phosphate oxidase-like [Ruditapes philippinarum]
MADLSDMRHPYHGIDFKFDMSDLASRDPIKQFEAWFEDIRKNKKVEEPNAMALATATRSGIPSVRIVLCKNISPEGFTFFTNYESKKGKELEENPQCSLMFYWEPLKRSVRIEGKVEKISTDKSKEYFNSRPKESQIGAIVSNQSTVIPDRQTLDRKLKDLKEQYGGDDVTVPKPDYWGGFLVRPYQFEFWQGQTNRLHDRIQFRKLSDGETFNETLMVKGEGDWIIERLSS